MQVVLPPLLIVTGQELGDKSIRIQKLFVISMLVHLGEKKCKKKIKDLFINLHSYFVVLSEMGNIEHKASKKRLHQGWLEFTADKSGSRIRLLALRSKGRAKLSSV